MDYEKNEFEDINEVKEHLSGVIADASAQLEELEELTCGLEELSEEEENDTTGGGVIVSSCSTVKTINGTMTAMTLSECIQSFTLQCGMAKKVTIQSRTYSDFKIFVKGKYLYVQRGDRLHKGTIKAHVTGSLNNANITWKFK